VKWKFDELDSKPELSSDLEWMLQSGQVSREYFLETLAEAYYLRIFRLAISLLNDTRAAEIATRRAFMRAVLDHHKYRSDSGVDLWLLKIAYQTITQAQQNEAIWKGIERVFSLSGELTNPAARRPAGENDQSLLQAFDRLDAASRNMLILQYANGFSLEQVAQITGYSLPQITYSSERALSKLSQEAGLGGEEIEPNLARVLESCWQVAQPSSDELTAFARSVNGQATGRHVLRGRVTTIKEMAVIGLAILIVFLMIWGGNRFFLRPEEGSNLPGPGEAAQPMSTEAANSTPEKRLAAEGTRQATQGAENTLLQPRPTTTPTPAGVFYYVEEGDTLADLAARFQVRVDELIAYNRIPIGASAILGPGYPLVIPGRLPGLRSIRATPVTPVARKSIARPVRSEEVFAMLNPDVFPFNSLWLDGEVVSHPDGDRLSNPLRSRIQVWLSQRQFLLIGGAMGQAPEEVGIGFGGRMYIAKPGKGEYFFEDFYDRRQGRTPLSVPLFFGLFMLFGDSDEIVDAEFTLLGESQAAGREVWVVSQSKPSGDRQAVLWLDKETGFSLRVRRLDQPDFIGDTASYQPSEVIIHSIRYDVNFPQELFDFSLPWRGGYALDYSGEPAFSPEREEIEYPTPQPVKFDALPDEYDLGNSRLSFRFPVSTDPVSPTIVSEIYADDYLLGRIPFTIPWDANCKRSIDGYKVVFSSNSSSTGSLASSASGAYYFDLRAINDVYRLQPADNGAGGDFAISPDNHTVAFWGCGGKIDACGVYLHDLETHKWRKLTDNEEGARGFVWSPDGKTLVWMTAGEVVIAMDVDSGEIVYLTNFSARNQAPPPQSPMQEWGISFPSKLTGLEGCIFPPQSES
jgi:RNA polymerase sigma factor (sigma-70 family)